MRVAHLNEVSVEQIVVLVKKTCGRKTKTSASVCVAPTKLFSELLVSLFGRRTGASYKSVHSLSKFCE